MSSNAASTVAKNSIWLVVQPLVLSVLSLFVVGLVARKLGPEEYGVFVFALAFTMLFRPVINMGLRGLMVRAIAEDKSIADEYLGQTLVLRFVLGILAIGLTYIFLNLFEYSEKTIQVTMIASLILLLQSLFTAFHDFFQAFEKMRYVAISQFISGCVLSLCTVVAVLAGYGLVEIIIIYVLGNVLTLITCIYYQWKYFRIPRLRVNIPFFSANLKKGFPFFIPQILYTFNSRLGVLMIADLAGARAVAMYGAATNLTDKLLVVPEGIGASIFPAIASLAEGRRDEAIELYRSFSRYVLLLGLPLAAGTTGLSDHVIDFIYGDEYVETALILSVLIWGTLFQFIMSIKNWTLNAMHYEKMTAIVPIITTPIFFIGCYFLVQEYGVLGAAIAFLGNCILTFIILSILVNIYITPKTYPSFFFIRSMIAVISMYIVILYIKPYGFLLSFISAVIVYLSLLVILRLIDKKELLAVKKLIYKK